jgi:type II secretory pathway component GspD/PulD (secretin)
MGTNKKIVIITISFFGIFLCIYSQALKAEDSASKSSSTSDSLEKSLDNKSLSKISDQNEIIQKSYQLINYLPSEMEPVLKPIISKKGSLTADDGKRILKVTDTVKKLLQIERIITTFDLAGGDEPRFQIFELKYIDPNKATEIINKILELQGEIPSKDVYVLPAQDVFVSLADQKKWLIAQAPESKYAETMTQIEKLIQRLDVQDANAMNYELITYRYIKVSEIAYSLTKYLAEADVAMLGLGQDIILQPLKASNQLLIFGKPDAREIIKKLVGECPKFGTLNIERIQLRYADPNEIKKKIDKIYKGDCNLTYADIVKVVVFPSQQQISVIASKKNMEIIETLINEWDLPIDVEKLRPRVIALQNADPNQMATMLHSVLLSCTPVSGTKIIIVICNSIEGYDVTESLIRELDSQKMAYKPSTIQLQNADPNEIKKKIDELYKDGNSQTSDTVKIIAYLSQRQIIVIASPENTENIRLLIKELDKPRTLD